jgi:hypothetical protein
LVAVVVAVASVGTVETAVRAAIVDPAAIIATSPKRGMVHR